MTVTISKWGNSQGLRFPKEIMQAMGLSAGDKVSIRTEDRKVIIEPVKNERKKIDIRDLVEKIPQEYTPEELFDTRAGTEAW